MDDKIKTLRDAIEWLYSRIREEAELDGEMSNDHAIQLGFITNMLEKFPPRNCDVGTAEEQVARRHAYCYRMMEQNNHCCGPCPCYKFVNGEVQSCTLLWAQMPYEAEEGGAK